jgi:hypothetical protein
LQGAAGQQQRLGVGDTEQLYRAHLRTVMLGMGFHSTRIDPHRRRRRPHDG